MTLTITQHGGPWDLPAKTFRFKTLTFEQQNQKYSNMVSGFAYNEVMEGLAVSASKTTPFD